MNKFGIQLTTLLMLTLMARTSASTVAFCVNRSFLSSLSLSSLANSSFRLALFCTCGCKHKEVLISWFHLNKETNICIMCLVCCYWLAIISFYLGVIMHYWCCEGRLYLLNVAKDYFYLQTTHYNCDDTKAIKYRSPHMCDIRPANYGVFKKQCVT